MALRQGYNLPPPPLPDADFGDYSWKDWFRQLRDYIVDKGTILWSQIDFTGSKLSDIQNRPHNVLQSIQGGNSTLGQYYHLNQLQYDTLTTATNGQLLIGNTGTNSFNKSTLTAGSGISITNGAGSITIASTGGSGTPPVTKTADFTVASTDQWLINNKSGSTCTVTLPTASSYSGRILHFQNYQAYTVVSASSNVVPIAGGSATTAILSNVAGDTCTLVSDGTNWVMTQYTTNGALLI